MSDEKGGSAMFVLVMLACAILWSGQSKPKRGGSIVFILVILFCAILWSNQPKPKAEITPSPDGLIEEFDMLLPGKTGLILYATEMAKRSGNASDHSVDANKIDDPKPVPSPSDKPSKPEIIIFTSPSCPPCEKWKRCEASKFEANGWKVAYCEQHDYPRTPTFLLTKEGKTVEKVGYFTFEQLSEVWK